MIRKELLDMLICPASRAPLELAPQALIDLLNRRREAGQLHCQSGQLLSEPLDGGLVARGGEVLYPIIDGIPVLLLDEAIPLAQLDAE